MDYQIKVSRKIDRLRNKGWTYTAIGEQAGVTPATVSGAHLMSHKTHPDTAEKILLIKEVRRQPKPAGRPIRKGAIDEPDINQTD